ncbi:MAG: DUF2459 domain-containing protein [Acidiferrobacter sp.]
MLATPRCQPSIPQRPALGILRNGWHTGLLLPASALVGPLAPIVQWFPHAQFLAIGWGNRRYYRARDPSLLTGLRALFPSPSVLHLTAWTQHRVIALQPPARLYWRYLTPRAWRRLRTFLIGSFAHSPHGGLEALGPTTPHGLFFASNKTYDAWHTCNTWTASALTTAGLPLRPHGIIFASAVTRALRASSHQEPHNGPSTAANPDSRKRPQGCRISKHAQ